MSKIIDIQRAVEKIPDGCTLGLSGFSYMNPPMKAVREIIRQKKKNLTIVSGPTSGIETDMLIGAGSVKKIITACVSFEKIAGIAPNFRNAAENKGLEIWECDEAIWHLSLKAGTFGLPYILYPGGVGSSIPNLNNEISMIKDHSKRYLKIPPIKIDIAIIHSAYGDEYGNVVHSENIYLGRTYSENILSQNAKYTIATVEHIVPNEFIKRHPHNSICTNAQIVKARFGAHPGACSGMYRPDLEHYKEYVKAAEDSRVNKTNSFQKYLKKYCNTKNYLNKFHIKRILELEHY